MPQVHAIRLRSLPPPSEIETAGRSFMLDREAKRCTAATLAWYERYIGALVSWLVERKVSSLADVSPNQIRQYLLDLRRPSASQIAPYITTPAQPAPSSISA